jgi:hypothetical protein
LACRSYEKFIGTEQGDHLARNYNESAFLTTVQVRGLGLKRFLATWRSIILRFSLLLPLCVCRSLTSPPLAQSMAVLARSPPMDFTELCNAHFQVTGPKILAVCRALLANNAAGATSAAGHELMAVLPHPKCSSGFLHVLAKITAALEAKYGP